MLLTESPHDGVHQRNMTDKLDPLKSTLDYYQSNSDQFIEGTINVDMGGLYQPFLENLPITGKILDAGCGPGRDTKFFLEKGFDSIIFTSSPLLI